MKITLIVVGKIKESFYRDAVAEYAKRLASYCQLQILEVEDEPTGEGWSEARKQEAMKKEGRRILQKIPKGSYVAAGSTITENVPAGSLAIARERQTNKPGWANQRRKDGKLK